MYILTQLYGILTNTVHYFVNRLAETSFSVIVYSGSVLTYAVMETLHQCLQCHIHHQTTGHMSCQLYFSGLRSFFSFLSSQMQQILDRPVYIPSQCNDPYRNQHML